MYDGFQVVHGCQGHSYKMAASTDHLAFHNIQSQLIYRGRSDLHKRVSRLVAAAKESLGGGDQFF